MKTDIIKFRIYTWKGVDDEGVLQKGILPAETIELAETQLRSQGIELTLLKPTPKLLAMGQFKKIVTVDIVVFFRQTATMVSAGIPLVKALDIVSSGLDNLSMRAIVITINNDVKSGLKFSDALKKHPRQFSFLVQSLIRTGEESGTLEVILDQIASHMERVELLKGRIKKAMLYPTIILVVTLTIAVMLLIFIVPQFQDLFASFGAELPLPTQIMINMSDVLQKNGGLIFGGLITAIVAFVYFKRHSISFQRFLDRRVLKVAIFGSLIRKSIIARIARTLSITLAAGVPIANALYCVSDVADNSVYRDAMLRVREDVVGGKQLFTSLQATKLFPSMLLQMIGV